MQSAAYSRMAFDRHHQPGSHGQDLGEAATGTMRLTYTGHTGRLLYGVFSPDGARRDQLR